MASIHPAGRVEDAAAAATAAPVRAGILPAWWRAAPPPARRGRLAAAFGWMLDAFDVMPCSMVTAAMMPALGMSTATAGQLGSLTLLASAGGGLLFGVIADRYGRTRALMGSVLVYSIFTAACGLAQSVWQLA